MIKTFAALVFYNDNKLLSILKHVFQTDKLKIHPTRMQHKKIKYNMSGCFRTRYLYVLHR